MRSSRRSLVVAVLFGIAAAVALFASAREPWADGHAAAAPGFPTQLVTRTGNDVAPLVGAAGYLAVAGLAAVVATRRWGRRVIGALLTLAGLAVAGVAAAADPVTRTGNTALHATAWQWVGLAGGLLLAAAGSLVFALGPRWSAMSARYDAPAIAEAARRAPAVDPDVALWDALDDERDPTQAGDHDQPIHGNPRT